MSLLESLKALLDTEEGKKSLEDFGKKISFKYTLRDKYIEKLHSIILSGVTLSSLIEKVQLKYDSDKYRARYRGIEPPEGLYWVIFNYAQKYGRKCDKHEWEEYSNQFTSALYFIDGHYVSVIVGQGSFVQLEKTNYVV